MSPLCMITPPSTETTSVTSSHSTSRDLNHVSEVAPGRNQRISSLKSDTGFYPSPPPSPLGTKRTHWDSGLTARPSPQVPLKRRCSGFLEGSELERNISYPNISCGRDMTPDRNLENGRAPSNTHSQPVNHSNGHEQVSNVGSKSTNAIMACNGSSSTSATQKPHGQALNNPPAKKKRYFEVDPFTGEERITEIMERPASLKGEGEKRVYALPGFTPRGHGHVRSGSFQSMDGRSASPHKAKSPSGDQRRSLLLSPILPFRTAVDAPEPALDRNDNICESPAELSRATSLGAHSFMEEDKKTRIEGERLSGELPSQASLTAPSSVSSTAGGTPSMGPAAESSRTPVPASFATVTSIYGTTDQDQRSVSEGRQAPSQSPALGSLHLNVMAGVPVLDERGLHAVSKDLPKASVSPRIESKKRREPPPPLSLADNAGNFATLASSRIRRQASNLTNKESTPGKTKSVPVTPVESQSRKGSHSPNRTQPSSPGTRALSPISPPPQEYSPRVPPDVSEKMIETHVNLYSMRCGEPPSPSLRRRRLKGKYRLPMGTDRLNLHDFIVLREAEMCYWGYEKEGELWGSSEEDETSSSTDVERWSGGNVKGPKYRAKPKPIRRSEPANYWGVSKTPNSVSKPKSSKKPRPKSKNNALGLPGEGKGKRHQTNAGTVNMDSGMRTKPSRKLSSLTVDDYNLLVDDPMDLDYGPRVSTAASSRPGSRGGPPSSSTSGQPSTRRPQRMATKYRASARDMSSIDGPVATASSPYPFISDTEISSDEDIIPAASTFGHSTASTPCTKKSLAGQSREQRKQDRADAIRFTESGPGSKGLKLGSSSIFSIAQLSLPGLGVMGPPSAKVSPAELKLYIGRRGDQVPLFGSGGTMVVPGLGSGPAYEQVVVGGDTQHGGSSLFQPGGIVEVRRVEDPLLEARMEVKRLIYDSGTQSELAPEKGVLGGLNAEKVYWSGEREASLTKPFFGIGVDFSGRPLIKALTFSNPLTNHSYTLLFVWAFLPVNTPEKNKENAVGNSMLLSDEVKGEGANNLHSDDIRASFQVHLCVGKPGRVQKKEERKRIVFVQVLNSGKGGRSSKSAASITPVIESLRWERWELDGLMRGLTRLWLERTKPRRGAAAIGLPRTLKRSSGVTEMDDLENTEDSIGQWLERDILGLGSEFSNGSTTPTTTSNDGSTSPNPQAKKARILPDDRNKVTTHPISLPPIAPSPSTTKHANNNNNNNNNTTQTTIPMYYLQASYSRPATATATPDLTTLPPPPSSPKKTPLTGYTSTSTTIDLETLRRANHRKEVLLRELSREVLPEVGDGIIEPETEEGFWWQA